MLYMSDTYPDPELNGEHDTVDSPASPLPPTQEERDLDVLTYVHRTGDPKVSQRTIAGALGMSVGLTNAILKRLADKGLLMVRRINQHNAHYLVTPDGIDQISRRSYRYLRRTIGHVVRYKERLRNWCRTQAQHGVTEIHLRGESDLTFILEWCAQKEGLTFRHSAGHGHDREQETPGALTILSENVRSTDDPDVELLHAVLLGEDR